MSDETIPLRLTRADADLIHRLRRDGICSDVEGLIERLDAALAADPEPEDLETAIRECEANGWGFEVWNCPTPSLFGAVVRCSYLEFEEEADTPLGALRQAMARARGTEATE